MYFDAINHIVCYLVVCTRYHVPVQRTVRRIPHTSTGHFDTALSNTVATHMRTPDVGKSYAIKVVACEEEADLESAKQEAELYSNYNHKHLIKIVSSEAKVGEGGSAAAQGSAVVLMVFPAYKQGTLQDKIEAAAAASESLPQRVVLELFSKICLGVLEMHTKGGMAHRDLKLANVLMDDDGVSPIVMDFGSADHADVVIASYKDALHYQEKAAQHSSMPYRAPELFGMYVSTEVLPIAHCSYLPVKNNPTIFSLGCSLPMLVPSRQKQPHNIFSRVLVAHCPLLVEHVPVFYSHTES